MSVPTLEALDEEITKKIVEAIPGNWDNQTIPIIFAYAAMRQVKMLREIKDAIESGFNDIDISLVAIADENVS